MPLFTYECKDCSFIFEELIRNNEEKVIQCLECKSLNVVQYIGKSSFILKGGGWAKDGYSKPPENARIDDGPRTAIRTPIISDRNTGKQIGYGTPETVKTTE